MKLHALALALSTLCLTSCAEHPRAIPVAPDPAKLADCPTTFPVAPTLPPLTPFTLPDGRVVVLLDTVIQRETGTVRYILQGRDAWHACSSAVVYVQDWTRAMGVH